MRHVSITSPALVALVIGLSSVAFLTYYRAHHPSEHRPDFDHLHAAAQFVVHGRDPYPLIGPTEREYRNSWPLYYPLPAVLAVAPLAPLSVNAARGVFVFVISALFGYALAVSGGTRWRFAILLSLPFIESVLIAQWSPLFFAMWTLPWLGALAVVKPNHAIAILAGRSKAWPIGVAIGGGVVLTAVSFAVQPGWFGEWLDIVRSAHHITAPVTRPWGMFLLIAAAKWRRPEARLLLVLAVIPSTPGFYETLVLFLVPVTMPEILVLVALGQFADILVPSPPASTWDDRFSTLARQTMWCLYLPTVLMLLRRPNEGVVPRWLEGRLTGFPPWLRGEPPRTANEARVH
jgi:hypothetical protein